MCIFAERLASFILCAWHFGLGGGADCLPIHCTQEFRFAFFWEEGEEWWTEYYSTCFFVEFPTTLEEIM
jgi:hypothetical protein